MPLEFTRHDVGEGDPGLVSNDQRALTDRIPCPVCRVDLTLQKRQKTIDEMRIRAGEVIDEPYLPDKSELQARYPNIPTNRKEWETRYAGRIRTTGRSGPERVAFYFETCSRCGLLYDPYAHQRAQEQVRLFRLLGGDLREQVIEMLADLAS